LVPVLRQLIDETGHRGERSTAVATLIERVSGGRTAIAGYLTQLTQALNAKDVRGAVAAVQAVLPRLESAHLELKLTFLATVLQRWYRQDLPPQPLMRVISRGKQDLDTLRLVALTLERMDWSDAVVLWDEYVTLAVRAGVLTARGAELSRILLHMAALFPGNAQEVWEYFDVDSEADLQQLIHTGQLPACFDRGGILQRAREADPDPLVFRALVAHYDQRQPKRAEAEAEAWHTAHPQDLEPLLYLIRAAESRGAVRKALNLLAEAESINRVHPEVRQSRFRLLLTGAERRIRDNKLTLTLTDLDRLDEEPRAAEGEHRAYLLALRWVVARKAGDAPAARQLEERLETIVGNPALYDLLLEAVARSFAIEPPGARGRYTPAQALEALVRGVDLFRALNRPLAVPPTLLTQAEKSLQTASMTQLHSLCLAGLWIGRPALTYAASGLGFRQDGALLHRFLLARGQALKAATGIEAQERAWQCLRAARELAGRARDQDAVREAAAALQTLPVGNWFNPLVWDSPALSESPATQEEIQRTIRSERQRRTTPRFIDTRAPQRRRRRRSARRPTLRGMFRDLFTWTEGKP
jgi:hypothetical protein